MSDHTAAIRVNLFSRDYPLELCLSDSTEMIGRQPLTVFEAMQVAEGLIEGQGSYALLSEELRLGLAEGLKSAIVYLKAREN